MIAQATSVTRPPIATATADMRKRLVASVHTNLFSRFQLVGVEKAQEGGVLIGHATHHQRHVQRTRQQRVQLAMRDGAIGIRNRIAVWVHAWPSQHSVHALNQTLGDCMLELFGLVVHLVPAVAQHPDQEGLHQPVPANHRQRCSAARVGQRHRAVLLVVHQALIGQLANGF